MAESGNGQILFISFLSFCISVIAAVIAIDMYRLLRTGQFGASWRVLIIASVMFALLHALRFGEHFEFTPWTTFHLSDVVEFVFVIALAYAFFLQRQTFKGTARFRDDDDHHSYSVDQTFERREDKRASRWNRLVGHADEVDDGTGATPLTGQLHDDSDIEWGEPEPSEADQPTTTR